MLTREQIANLPTKEVKALRDELKPKVERKEKIISIYKKVYWVSVAIIALVGNFFVPGTSFYLAILGPHLLLGLVFCITGSEVLPILVIFGTIILAFLYNQQYLIEKQQYSIAAQIYVFREDK